MFKNRSVRITLDKDNNKTPNEQRQIDRDEVAFWNAVLVANAERLGGALILLYGAKKAIDTASAVFIKMAPQG